MSMFQEFLGDPKSSFKCAHFLSFSFILHYLLIAACWKLRAGTKWKPNRLINSVYWSICSSGIVPASAGNSLICAGGLAYGWETPRQRSGSWGVEGLCTSMPNGSVKGGGLGEARDCTLAVEACTEVSGGLGCPGTAYECLSPKDGVLGPQSCVWGLVLLQ